MNTMNSDLLHLSHTVFRLVYSTHIWMQGLKESLNAQEDTRHSSPLTVNRKSHQVNHLMNLFGELNQII